MKEYLRIGASCHKTQLAGSQDLLLLMIYSRESSPSEDRLSSLMSFVFSQTLSQYVSSSSRTALYSALSFLAGDDIALLTSLTTRILSLSADCRGFPSLRRNRAT